LAGAFDAAFDAAFEGDDDAGFAAPAPDFRVPADFRATEVTLRAAAAVLPASFLAVERAMSERLLVDADPPTRALLTELLSSPAESNNLPESSGFQRKLAVRICVPTCGDNLPRPGPTTRQGTEAGGTFPPTGSLWQNCRTARCGRDE
jgi:hypothetical protein